MVRIEFLEAQLNFYMNRVQDENSTERVRLVCIQPSSSACGSLLAWSNARGTVNGTAAPMCARVCVCCSPPRVLPAP